MQMTRKAFALRVTGQLANEALTAAPPRDPTSISLARRSAAGSDCLLRASHL